MANIKLKNRTGEDVVCENISTVKLLDTNGNIQYYIKGQYTTEDLPQLYAPTAVSKTTSEDLKYFTITNPTNKNGIFPRILQVVTKEDEDTDYTVVAEVSLSDTEMISSIKVYSENFFKIVGANQPVIARFIGDAFLPSETYETSDYTYSVGEFNYDLSNVTIPDNNVEYFFSDDAFKFSLTTDEGYYLPKTIEITGVGFDDTEIQPTYEYSPDANELYITECGVAKIINLVVHATQTYWLRNPQLSIGTNVNGSTVYVDWIDSKADTTNIICDDKVLTSVVDNREGMVDYSVSGHTSVSENTYQLKSGFTYQTTIATLTFNMITAGIIQLYIYNYNYPASYDVACFTEVSKVDAVLDDSTSQTNASDRLFTTYNHNAGTYKTTTLSIDVPAGIHTIQIAQKNVYDKNGYANFRIETAPSEKSSYDMGDYLDNYGIYSLSAQSIAEGCDPSDVVEIGDVTFNPIINSTDNILSVINAVPEIVTSFELYVDDTLSDTITYDSTTGFSVDLSTYIADTSEHSVYVKGIGDNVAENQSNTLAVTITATETTE